MFIDDGADHEYAEQENYSYAEDGVLEGVAVDAADDGHLVTVDTAYGTHVIGPATIDTNHDGHPDTAVVHDAQGDTVLYTDTHGDGQADVATELTPDGQVVIADHTGPHQWTEVQHGHLDGNGQYHQDSTGSGTFTPPVPAADTADDQHWSDTDGNESGWAAPFSRTAFSETGSAQGVVRIDATTGQWISQN
ncbi:MAG TPA: hypothetical protein VGD84_25080 [Pseudonocardiaceae bacterium]